MTFNAARLAARFSSYQVLPSWAIQKSNISSTCLYVAQAHSRCFRRQILVRTQLSFDRTLLKMVTTCRTGPRAYFTHCIKKPSFLGQTSVTKQSLSFFFLCLLHAFMLLERGKRGGERGEEGGSRLRGRHRQVAPYYLYIAT